MFAALLILSTPTLNKTNAAKNLNNQSHRPAQVKTAAAVKETETQVKAEAVVIQPAPQTTVNLDDHQGLMSLAGISQNDWPAADYIVSHESSWNPLATEPTTGAHGLPQALPYSKTGCGWEDAVCQLRWANDYAIARYGGWWSAYYYWVNHRNW